MPFKCSSCGEEISKDANFCEHCGADFSSSSSSYSLQGFVPAFGLAFVLIGALLAYNGHMEMQEFDTVGGEVARTLSETAQDRYRAAEFRFYGGLAGVVVGAGLLFRTLVLYDA